MQIVAAIEYDRLRQEPGTWNKVIHRLRHELFDTDAFHRVGYFDRDMTQFFLRRQ